MILHTRGDFAASGARSFPGPAIDGLAHLWQGYLTHGRRQLAALGDRVLLEPEIASGFGRADLVAGRCLVDVKTVLDPFRYFKQWLNQVLGYVLLDWANVLCLDAAGIYLGWQALLLSEPVTSILAASVPGPTPTLESLRADFRLQMQPEVDESLNARLRHRYPVPHSPNAVPPGLTGLQCPALGQLATDSYAKYLSDCESVNFGAISVRCSHREAG